MNDDLNQRRRLHHLTVKPSDSSLDGSGGDGSHNAGRVVSSSFLNQELLAEPTPIGGAANDTNTLGLATTMSCSGSHATKPYSSKSIKCTLQDKYMRGTAAAAAASSSPAAAAAGGGGGGGGTGSSSLQTQETTSTPRPTFEHDMLQMSANERNAIQEEIHGIHTIQDEDPDHVDFCIRQIQKEIKTIKQIKKEAYQKACFLAPTKYHYCQDDAAARNFYLMFLRSTNFDITKASIKILNHFNEKSKLWGMDKVATTITIEDLNDDDMYALKLGATQLLPSKDTAGRAIFFMSSHIANPRTWISHFRANWFVFMTAIENDEMLQKLGIVFIGYEVGSSLGDQLHKIKANLEFASMYDAIPYRTTSMHYCYNDTTLKAGFNMFFQFYPQRIRIRFREHYGTSHIECQYKIMSFGISPDMLPVDHTGYMKQSFIDKHIERLRTATRGNDGGTGGDMMVMDAASIGESVDDANNIEVATDNDVLLGRGIPCQTHPGNIRLAKLIKSKQDEFFKSSKFEKTVMTYEIMKDVENKYNGRFLEKDTVGGYGTWKVCSRDTARKKVSYGFRSLVKSQRKYGAGNSSSNASTTTTTTTTATSISSSLSVAVGSGNSDSVNNDTSSFCKNIFCGIDYNRDRGGSTSSSNRKDKKQRIS